jgi:hypothetical protein
MNTNQFTLTGPFSHENLRVFLVHGSDAFDGRRFLTLDQAMDLHAAIVHETGHVGQLAIENLSEQYDLYVQSGDVVKGGRQDRTLGVDFVLPAKSAPTPIPSFCVEQGRWSRRAGESTIAFGSSKEYLASKHLRMAAKYGKSQGAVWSEVANIQKSLSQSIQKQVHSNVSPTSYQLAMEDEDLQKRKGDYLSRFAWLVDDAADAIGYAFVINNQINTADLYGSHDLFRRLWSKLINAAIFEAIAELPRQSEAPREPVTADAIREWFREAETAEVTLREEVPPRVHVETRRSPRSFVFETCDHGLANAVLHRNLVTN